jgi:hypothetical protein
VAFTSFEIGQQLYNESTGTTPPRMSLDIKLVVDPNRTDWNVIAESKGGDPNHVVVVEGGVFPAPCVVIPVESEEARFLGAGEEDGAVVAAPGFVGGDVEELDVGGASACPSEDLADVGLLLRAADVDPHSFRIGECIDHLGERRQDAVVGTGEADAVAAWP